MEYNDEITLVIQSPTLTPGIVEDKLGVESKFTPSAAMSIAKIRLVQNRSTDELADWLDFVYDKRQGLKDLIALGHTCYLDCALKGDSLFADRDVLRTLTEAGIELSVWCKRPEPKQPGATSDFFLTINEPLQFFSPLDEDAYFYSLNAIEGILSWRVDPGKPLKSIPNKIVLMLEAPTLHEYALRKLIGLCFRYAVDMTSLASQCTPENQSWFKSPSAYWHDAVFAAPQNT